MSVLFDVDTFEIQEDFLQISELVNTEKAFMNRSTPVDSSGQFSPENYLTDVSGLSYKTFFTEYQGSPAILSEKISALGESVLEIYNRLGFYQFSSNVPEEKDFWILGADYNYISAMDGKNGVKCGASSCYEQSLRSGKICKPGRFRFCCFFLDTFLNILK